MDKVVQLASNEVKNVVEIVVHIKKYLEQEQRDHLVSQLKKTDGIIGAEFCPLRNHLVLAKYNKDIFSSQDVLKTFNSLRLEARLIGPI
jgi:cell division protein FtsX